jgi:hypothetical protein
MIFEQFLQCQSHLYSFKRIIARHPVKLITLINKQVGVIFQNSSVIMSSQTKHILHMYLNRAYHLTKYERI